MSCSLQINKVIVIGVVPRSLVIFRGDFLKALALTANSVTTMAGSFNIDTARFMSDLGIKYQVYPIQRRKTNPFSDLKTYKFFKKYFSKEQPEVILAYTIKPIIWAGFAARSLSNIRFYAMVEGTGYAFQGGGLLRNLLKQLVVILYRVALRRADAVIFLNQDNRREFIEMKIIPDNKARLINGIGVNLEQYPYTAIPPGKTTFLSIGRLLGEKGFREYAQAAKVVKEKYPDTVFQLLGAEDPSADGISVSEIKNWDRQGWIEYLGSTSDVRPYLKGCHIYVLPSYHEGMPRTVLEAMAIGRAILTTNVPGCRETVVSGENGFLVPKANVSALVEQMIWFIENKEQWGRMGKRSRELAKKKYDVRKVNKHLMEIMDIF